LTRQTRISAWADRTIEACWLLALVFAPYFFNLLTARHFEPDKATVVRAIALIALAAWAIKSIERRWRCLRSSSQVFLSLRR
jgi:hypothetical protein